MFRYRLPLSLARLMVVHCGQWEVALPDYAQRPCKSFRLTFPLLDGPGEGEHSVGESGTREAKRDRPDGGEVTFEDGVE
jgi:hypothetical protein